MFGTVDYISLCGLFGKLQQVDSASRVDDVNSYVTDLAQTIGTFIEAHKFGD